MSYFIIKVTTAYKLRIIKDNIIKLKQKVSFKIIN